jgi:hypothetical protein
VETVVDAGGGGRIVQTLYKRRFPAGKIDLGGNLAANSTDNFSMYSVFVVADSGSTVTAAKGKTPSQMLRQRVDDYSARFNQIMAAELPDYNRKMAQVIRNNVQAMKAENAKAFAELPTPTQIANAILSATPNDGNAYSIDLRDYIALPQKKGEAIRLQKKKKSTGTSVEMKGILPGFSSVPVSLLKPIDPRKVQVDGIAEIVSFPGVDEMSPGDYVYVSGTGFGSQPGSITLEYLIKPGEFDNWSSRSVKLDPKADKITWRNNLIVFRLPENLPDVKMANVSHARIGKAVLSFRFSNGSNASRQIKLIPGQVYIQDIWTDSSLDVIKRVSSSGYEWSRFRGTHRAHTQFYSRTPLPEADGVAKKEIRSIEAGSDVYISGVGFGNQPGTIEIVADGKKIPIIPAPGEWWNNFGIRFKVGSVPGILNRHEAKLRITTTAGSSIYNAQFSFVYGPEQSLKVVSGEPWFEPEWDEDTSYAKEDPDGIVLFVSHDPGCGWFSTSESGWDHFFSRLELPPGVTLEHYMFMEIKHKDADDQIRYLKNYLKDLLFSLEGFGVLNVAIAVIVKNLKLAAQSVIDSLFGDGGSYYAYQPDMPDANDPSPPISVRWENACTGANAGLPIMYTTTFTISGPKTVLDKL